MWHDLAAQPALWSTVRMKNSQVVDLKIKFVKNGKYSIFIICYFFIAGNRLEWIRRIPEPLSDPAPGHEEDVVRRWRD